MNPSILFNNIYLKENILFIFGQDDKGQAALFRFDARYEEWDVTVLPKHFNVKELKQAQALNYNNDLLLITGGIEEYKEGSNDYRASSRAYVYCLHKSEMFALCQIPDGRIGHAMVHLDE